MRMVAAAAALARLDALGVSPLQACLAQGRLEAMDDQGKLDGEEPAFTDHGVDPAHVEAYGAAVDAAAAVFTARGVGQRTGGIIVTVPDAVLAEERASGKDLSVAP